jgi:hypothetical protein
VGFIVAPARIQLFRGHRGAKLVYDDGFIEVWRLDESHPIVSASGCSVEQMTQDSYVTTCPHQSLLMRTEVYFPGWSATVNGAPVMVEDRTLMQAILIPKGRSTVEFTFLPPGIPAAGMAALIAVLSLLVPWELLAVRLRRRREAAARLAGLEAIATQLSIAVGRDADDVERPPDPSTGVIAVQVSDDEDEELATSAVPVLTAESPVATETGEAPTSAVSVIELATPSKPDPPTIAVPRSPSGTDTETE